MEAFHSHVRCLEKELIVMGRKQATKLKAIPKGETLVAVLNIRVVYRLAKLCKRSKAGKFHAKFCAFSKGAA